MTSNVWVPALKVRQLKNQPQKIDFLNLVLVVFRDSKGKVSALFDLCPHRHVSLSKGKVKGDLIECPYHGLRFDGNGYCKFVPVHDENDRLPTTKVETYPVRESSGWIWISTEPSLDTQLPNKFFNEKISLQSADLLGYSKNTIEKLKTLDSIGSLKFDSGNHGSYFYNGHNFEFWILIVNDRIRIIVALLGVKDFWNKIRLLIAVRSLRKIVLKCVQV